MGYCFRFALAAGLLALPLSLLAAERSPHNGGDRAKSFGPDHAKWQSMAGKLKEHQHEHPPLTPEQKEKLKAAMQQMEQKRKDHHQEMQAKLKSHLEELRTKRANGQANHPNNLPGTQNGIPGHRKLPAGEGKFGEGQIRKGHNAGSGPKSLGERDSAHGHRENAGHGSGSYGDGRK